METLVALSAVLLTAEPVQDDMVFVALDGGVAIVGCDAASGDAEWKCRPEWRPRRTVAVAPFELDRHKVTRGEYAQCVARGHCSSRDVAPEPEGAMALPATDVTWFQADDYCTDLHKRLPTAAELEAAARGSSGRTFPWGEAEPWREPGRYVAATGSLQDAGALPDGASEFGVLELSGNGAEWTLDAWPSHGKPVCHRVTHGGPAEDESFEPARPESYAWAVSASRGFEGPMIARPDVGFRCARSAGPQPDPGSLTGDDCDEGLTRAEKQKRHARYEVPVSLFDGFFRAAPVVGFSGFSVLGWALSTQATGFSESRWALDAGGLLVGQVIGSLAGFLLTWALIGLPASSREGGDPASLQSTRFEGAVAAAAGTLFGIAGASVGIAIAEARNNNSPAGAYVAMIGTMALGYTLTGLTAALLAVPDDVPPWFQYLVLALGALASTSMGLASFAAVRH